MRITAGRLKGRRLNAPNIPGLRPTPSKVRQAMFNILGNIEGWQALDLFSGSGLIALESLSRGAEQAISIERHHKACHYLNQTRREWGLEENWHILSGDVRRSLTRLEDNHFNLIFADPPYEKGIAEQVPVWLGNHGISCRWLVMEESARIQPRWPAGWSATQTRRYGDTCLHFLAPEKQE